ncbi:MAG: S41 family peptidase [Holosporales bacterium]|jgi:carboxyl-terminal processing protease|nr:S41 family peptidase [Holosporales bacterium]
MRHFVVAGISLCFSLGVPLKAEARLPIPKEVAKSIPKENQAYCLFTAVLKLIKENYVLPIDDEKLIEQALVGTLSALDPHSCYLDKKALDVMRLCAEGRYGGIGIEITMNNGFPCVITPIDGTPASRAGIQSGDLITHVNGTFVQNICSEEIIAKLRGKPGSKVHLTIKRLGRDLFQVPLIREDIRIQSVRSEIHKGIGYIRIALFDKGTAKELKTVLENFKREKIKGIVLDMRNNSGGLLEEGVDVADFFLNGGEIVSMRGRDPAQNVTFRAKEGEFLPDIPLVVLVNNGTASCPEIVAGALQYHHRAIIMGTQTFGKGSVQKILPFSEEGGIKLTVARHYLPSGDCIQGRGVTPDVVVPLAEIKIEKEIFTIREKDIPHALEEITSEVTPKKSEQEQKEVIEETIRSSTPQGIEDKKEGESDDKKALHTIPLAERTDKDLQLREAFSIVRALSCLPPSKT